MSGLAMDRVVPASYVAGRHVVSHPSNFLMSQDLNSSMHSTSSAAIAAAVAQERLLPRKLRFPKILKVFELRPVPSS